MFMCRGSDTAFRDAWYDVRCNAAYNADDIHTGNEPTVYIIDCSFKAIPVPAALLPTRPYSGNPWDMLQQLSPQPRVNDTDAGNPFAMPKVTGTENPFAMPKV